MGLWADGICINQNDDKEKGRQVALMGQIYETSRCTVICLGLGLDAEDRRCASDVAALIAEVDTMTKEVFDDPEFSWYWDSFPYPSADDGLLRESRWDSWERLVRQPWFTRGWVVQEAALGPDAVVFWAGDQIQLISVLRVNYWLMRRAIPLMPTFGARTSWIHTLHQDRHTLLRPKEVQTLRPWQARHPIEPMTALEILQYARSLQLGEPKDRIYVFMALQTSDKAMPSVQPEYGKDVSHLDVYRDFAVKYLGKTSDLDILRFIEHEEGVNSPSSVAVADARTRSLPSWAPRWDCGRMVTPLVDVPVTDRKIVEGERDNSKESSISTVEGNSRLRVRVIVFDSVKYISETIEEYYGGPQRPHAVMQVLSLWRNLTPQSEKHPGPHRDILGLAFLDALSMGYYLGDREEYFQSLHEFAQRLQSDQPSDPADAYAQDAAAQRISAFARRKSKHRRFVLLGRGYYGIAPKATREGDLCSIIFGTRAPFILRKVPGKQDQYSVAGPAYIHSKKCHGDVSGTTFRLAANEDWDDWEDCDLQTEDVILV